MTGVKTQTHKSNGSQFLAESGQWLPSRTIKTTFLKACFSSYWSQFPVRWDGGGCGRLLVKQHPGERDCLRGVFLFHPGSDSLSSPEVNIRTANLGLTGKHSITSLLPPFNSVSWLRRFNLNRLKGSTEYKINDLKREGDYTEMAWRQ